MLDLPFYDEYKENYYVVSASIFIPLILIFYQITGMNHLKWSKLVSEPKQINVVKMFVMYRMIP